MIIKINCNKRVRIKWVQKNRKKNCKKIKLKKVLNNFFQLEYSSRKYVLEHILKGALFNPAQRV